jgi:hypothetical protein
MSRISMDCLFDKCLRGFVNFNFNLTYGLVQLYAFQQNTHKCRTLNAER